MHSLTTSLSEIRAFRPCAEGWRNILAYRNSIAIVAGKEAPDHEEQFPLVSCLESNSIADVLWLIGKRKAEIQIAVKFARMCADSVAHLKNRYADNAADAADAAAYAAAYADTAADTTDTAMVAADDAVKAAIYTTAEDATAEDATVYAGYEEQKEQNKQFLIQCINDFPSSQQQKN